MHVHTHHILAADLSFFQRTKRVKVYHCEIYGDRFFSWETKGDFDGVLSVVDPGGLSGGPESLVALSVRRDTLSDWVAMSDGVGML